MGSPEFAIPTLQALIQEYPVLGVVTQPDRPAGRGRELKPPPVKLLALDAGIPLIQPYKMTEPEVAQTLESWAPDVIIVAAFGQILKSTVLKMAPYGALNVHASLLPRWRGASPIQAAILAGDPQTGITIMIMDEGIDTGPILSQREIDIQPDDTGALLSERLAVLGGDVLIETLPDYLSGKLVAQSQDERHATYAPMLKKAQGELDINLDAQTLARQVRAYDPWPGTFYTWHGKRLKIHRAHVVAERDLDKQDDVPAGPVVYDGKPALGTANGLLVLTEVQPAGKTRQRGEDFLRGNRTWVRA